jgi:hypothetical protein
MKHFFLSFFGKKIFVDLFLSGHPPVCVISASPDAGSVPLTVHFSSTGSTVSDFDFFKTTQKINNFVMKFFFFHLLGLWPFNNGMGF